MLRAFESLDPPPHEVVATFIFEQHHKIDQRAKNLFPLAAPLLRPGRVSIARRLSPGPALPITCVYVYQCCKMLRRQRRCFNDSVLNMPGLKVLNISHQGEHRFFADSMLPGLLAILRRERDRVENQEQVWSKSWRSRKNSENKGHAVFLKCLAKAQHKKERGVTMSYWQ